MSIKTNIEEVMEAIREGDTELALILRAKAVQAIKAGEGTPAWTVYMEQFSQDPDQLARLTPTDSTVNDFDFDVARTYLVGNGTCGAETTGYHLIEGVGDKLDEGLGV